jgi:hypothetical protein
MPGLAPAMENVPTTHSFALFLLVCLLGCGRPEPAASPAAGREASSAAAAGEFGEATWSSLELEALPALVTLPDARAWRAQRSGSFVVLSHRATESTLALRVWRAARLVRPSECEAEARLARPQLPIAENQNRIEERRLEAPSGFDVRLVVAAQPVSGSSVRGSALAVGAGVGRCYLASFETVADGPRAAERVAERLGVVVPGVLETVRLLDAERRVAPPPGVN